MMRRYLSDVSFEHYLNAPDRFKNRRSDIYRNVTDSVTFPLTDWTLVPAERIPFRSSVRSNEFTFECLLEPQLQFRTLDRIDSSRLNLWGLVLRMIVL